MKNKYTENNVCCDEKTQFDSMTKWRLEDCPAYADTYIEWCFEKRCKEFRNGVDILTEWREQKAQVISFLKISVFDFQHYSRHDESHAVSILESIEMLLGKDRIDKLSIGDLWLLLECAYFHDMGMSMNYEELVFLWRDDKEFKKYIAESIEKGKDAAVFYKVIDNLLRGNGKFDNLDHYLQQTVYENSPLSEIQDSWPVELERGLQEIIAEYIRYKHPQRLRETINKLDEKQNPQIPIRLYKIMLNACILHGEDFQEIFNKLPYCEKGFGNTSIHPRFAAAMLRIGDLLDMDNNRFDIRALEHYGELPFVSRLHFKKHKAITHLAIRPEGIEAEAKSPEVEVCVMADKWFQKLDKEIDRLICVWNQIVPKKLKGCLLTRCKFGVYIQSQQEEKRFDSRVDREFQVDKAKLIKLLMGTNIYLSSIDFIREYMQNALDASKMHLWLDIKKGRYKYSNDIRDVYNKKEINPFDIGTTIYNQYAIEIHVNTDIENHTVTLKFVDRGIGIEKECIDIISKIGGGWRMRKKYQEELNEMPDWLRPTGGFGIGLQSAFMVSDKVEIVTKGIDEKEGRKLTLFSPKTQGKIINEVCSAAPEGTSIEVTFDYFLISEVENEISESTILQRVKEPYELDENPFAKGNFFSQETAEEYVVRFVENYIYRYFAGTMIPFRIIYQKNRRTCWKTIDSLKFPELSVGYRNDSSSKSGKMGEKYIFQIKHKGIQVISHDISLNGKSFLAMYIPEGMDNKEKRLLFWNREDDIFSEINYKTGNCKGKNYVCFKNAKINRETSVDIPFKYFYDIFIDYQGFYAEKILKIHREAFNKEFNILGDKYVLEFFAVYFDFLKQLSAENQNFNFKKELYDLIPQLIQMIYLDSPLKLVQEAPLFIEGVNSEDDQKINCLRWMYDEVFDPTDRTAFEAFQIEPSRILQDIYSMMHPVDSMAEESIFISFLDFEENKKYSDGVIPSLLSQDTIKAWRDSFSLKWMHKELGEYWWKYGDNLIDGSDLQKAKPQLAEQTIEWLDERKLYFINASDTTYLGQRQKTKYLLDSLRQRGYVISDSNIIEFLLNCDKFEKEYFQFRKGDRVFVRMTWKKERTLMLDEDFYRLSYAGNGSWNPVFEFDRSAKYPELTVLRVPFGKVDRSNRKYLISPISKEIYDEWEKSIITNSSNSKLTYEEFLDVIINHRSYKALVHWVYRNQVERNCYTVSEIRAVYEKYIHDIYDWWEKAI